MGHRTVRGLFWRAAEPFAEASHASRKGGSTLILEVLPSFSTAVARGAAEADWRPGAETNAVLEVRPASDASPGSIRLLCISTQKPRKRLFLLEVHLLPSA